MKGIFDDRDNLASICIKTCFGGTVCSQLSQYLTTVSRIVQISLFSYYLSPSRFGTPIVAYSTAVQHMIILSPQ